MLLCQFFLITVNWWLWDGICFLAMNGHGRSLAITERWQQNVVPSDVSWIEWHTGDARNAQWALRKNCRLKKSPLFHSKESFLVSTHYPQIQYDFYSSRIANQHYRVEDTRKAVSQINSMKLQRNEIYKLVESIFTNWVELLNNNVLTKTNDIVQD